MKHLKNYFIKELGWSWGYQAKKVFQLLCDASTFCDGGIILDAGAGHMRYKPFFSNCIYLSQEHPLGIEFKKMGSFKYDLVSPLDKYIPLSNDSVSGIICTSVLEHIRYPENFFRESYRVLKPGGKIFINVPFNYPEHEIPFDFQRPTRYGLERWFEDAGFNEFFIEPSSSSIESACAFINDSLTDDLLKGFKRKDLSNIFKRKPPDILRILFTLVTYIILRFVSKYYSKLLKVFADRGGTKYTRFPVGWIAVATKPGLFKKDYYKNKAEYLAKNYNPDKINVNAIQ
jgi:SAM-dependent methyltransferase